VGGAQARVTVGSQSVSAPPDAWRHLQWPSRKVESFVVSFPKSGRTWLRVLLAVVEAHRRREGTDAVVGEWLEREAPTIGGRSVLFTHALSANAHERSEAMRHFLGYIGDRRRVFLLRDPRDTVVSYFFQVTKRQRGSSLEGDLGRFVRDPGYGIDRLLAFFAACEASLREDPGRSLVLAYEELHRDPACVLRAATEFLGGDATAAALDAAVAFGDFDNLHRLELEGRLDGQGRLAQRDPSNPESLKTRKGVVGGYSDYLSRRDLTYVEKRIEELMPPSLGYRTPRAPPPAAGVAAA
jgi:Sulfotransferase domain